ncbi:MAG: hypothetical protein ACFFG0_01085 [Candidatus Thorarchaeota archaeon]
MKTFVKEMSISILFVSIITFGCYSAFYVKQTYFKPEPVKLSMLSKLKAAIGLEVEPQNSEIKDFMTVEVDPYMNDHIAPAPLSKMERVKLFMFDKYTSTKDWSISTWNATKNKSKTVWNKTKHFINTLYERFSSITSSDS